MLKIMKKILYLDLVTFLGTPKNEYNFGKSCTRNLPGEIVPWACVIEEFNGE